MDLIVVPIVLLFGAFFGTAAVQALRKRWKRAGLSCAASFVVPLAFALPLFMQRDGVKRATSQLERRIQTHKGQGTNGNVRAVAGDVASGAPPMEHGPL